jgi:RNA polymerase sigma-70 factor (ECF subfamily)
MRRARDGELAADLAAETFAAALVAAPKYRAGEAPASAWLIGIARNTLSSSLRRARVEDRARRRLGMEPIVLDDSVLDRIEQLGGDTRVETLLAQLTPDQSDAVRARVLGEEDYAVIAARLRCSESVVRQRVSRGLATLRRIHEEETA